MVVGRSCAILERSWLSLVVVGSSVQTWSVSGDLVLSAIWSSVPGDLVLSAGFGVDW